MLTFPLRFGFISRFGWGRLSDAITGDEIFRVAAVALGLGQHSELLEDVGARVEERSVVRRELDGGVQQVQGLTHAAGGDRGLSPRQAFTGRAQLLVV